MASRGPCLVEGCEKAKHIRGWCRAHYARWQRWGSPTGGTCPNPNRECLVDECTRAVGPKGARGWCTVHYQRYLSTGSPVGTTRPSDAERLFAKVREAGDCWEWTGSLDGSGYGLFSTKREHQFMQRTHRWSYQYFRAEIPDGLQIDHLCRNRACCNPWHLEPVTPLVNSQRGLGPGSRTSCPQGHAYTNDNTYRTPDGRRVCRKCTAESRRRYEMRKKRTA